MAASHWLPDANRSRSAGLTDAEAYGLPVPFCFASAEHRAVLMEQRGLDEVFTLVHRSTLGFVGIGIVDARAASLAPLGMSGPQERGEMARAGEAATPEAISAVLAGGPLHGFLTDERTAAALVGPKPDGSQRRCNRRGRRARPWNRAVRPEDETAGLASGHDAPADGGSCTRKMEIAL